MHQPSNPFNFFINGNETKEFTYKPGATPYYVYVKQSYSIAFSVVIFADSEKHVKRILRKAVKFSMDCRIEYAHAAGQMIRQSGNWNMLGDILNDKSGPDKHLSIEVVNTNRPLQVSWASNDTID